ncbi:MAG: shikimate kinase [Balneolaceae bacterium]|jgi:shikimate kinase|nr:MAG: shikimate kinase [Balneolaceae bacterium]
MNRLPERIFLTGFMGAGKTTIGRILAGRFKYIFIDLDHYIEKKERKTVSYIFSKFGEAHFRNLEKKYLAELAGWKNVVVALGGGTLTDTDVVNSIKSSGVLVYIDVAMHTILERVKRNHKRPLLLDDNGSLKPDKILESELKELLDRRRQLYEMAHITEVQVAGNSAEKHAENLIPKIEQIGTSF